MRILGISGSLRAGSYNSLLLDNAAASMENSHSLEIHKLEGIPFYNEDLDDDSQPATVQRLLVAIQNADAMLLASPEYNHSIPGVLKNAIPRVTAVTINCWISTSTMSAMRPSPWATIICQRFISGCGWWMPSLTRLSIMP